MGAPVGLQIQHLPLELVFHVPTRAERSSYRRPGSASSWDPWAGRLVTMKRGLSGHPQIPADSNVKAEARVSVTIRVPGTSDHWLVGMTNGAIASQDVSAPAQSPVQVQGITIVPGTSLVFLAVGEVARGPGFRPITPTAIQASPCLI